MMKKFLLILAVAFGILGCNDSAKPERAEVKISYESLLAKNGEIKTVADILIEGMMCEKSCVSKVKSELEELACVKNVEIEFDAEKSIDVARVEYDKNECDEHNMISQIHNIGDGVYAVRAVSIKTYE